ncbi:MAG TPA: 6-phosphogluconolactonase [Candidatus Luteococcus avicola]|nr:6-phosphogluconolactonase [Candidatus Luteococcus avicola]
MTRVLRHQSADEMTEAAARRLLDRLIALQQEQETVHLCLAGGTTALRVYDAFADLAPESGLQPGKLTLWWGDEKYVPPTDAERNSLQSLAVLARTLPINVSQTHPIPAPTGSDDPSEAAFAYAQELGDVTFDICLLGMGADGHVAALFPHSPALEAAGLAYGVTDAPVEPAERVTLTLNAINRSKSVWLFVEGEAKVEALRSALAGDPDLPASHVRGTDETLWFIDPAASGDLPSFRCAF